MGITLHDLVGDHVLTGVDFSHNGEANTCLFVLDGVIYEASENDEDDYRSSMDELRVVSDRVVNTFPGCNVRCYMDNNTEWDDILIVEDAVTGKAVLEIGTQYHDDNYPCCVENFYPENMILNCLSK